MPLMKLQLQPGINRETTGYANEGGWWDSDKIRFRMGYPEKIGGWQKLTTSALLGTCRAIHPWVALDNNEYIGLGTTQKYYVYGSGVFNDITPIRKTTTAGAVTFAAAYSTVGAGGITAGQTNILLTSAASFPAAGGRILIGSEQITYAGVSVNTLLNCTRGVNGTTAAAHSAGEAVGCATVTVTNASHGAYQNDFVTFSGATTLGGNLTAAVLDQEYQVTDVLDNAVYYVEARTVSAVSSITTSAGLAPTYVFSTAADTGTGGTGTVGAYQINSGLATSISGSGWGAGVWGGVGWGLSADTTVPGAQLRLWGHDNYGQDLLFNVRDGGIYYWAKDTSYPRAVELASRTGAAVGKAPTIAKQILVSDNDRHVIAFGCDDEFTPGVQDPMLIRFSDSENAAEWRSLSTNSAGSLRIGSGSAIVAAIETKQQILVITDSSVHAMQFLGAPYTFGLTMVSNNVSISGPNAAIAVEDTVYWMGEGEFYAYNGAVTPLPCDVKDYVFSRINTTQTPKTAAAANISYGEVWWFYASKYGSGEVDSYVVYNYQQKIWYYGSMVRTAWTHKNLGIFPLAVGGDNHVYYHEYGNNDGSTNPPSGIPAFIESSGQDLGDGDQFAFIWRIIPDVTFRTSPNGSAVTFSVKMSNFPGTNFSQTDARTVTKGPSVFTVETFTKQLYTRLRGRSFTFRVESSGVDTAWRLGAPRLDIRTDGKR